MFSGLGFQTQSLSSPFVSENNFANVFGQTEPGEFHQNRLRWHSLTKHISSSRNFSPDNHGPRADGWRAHGGQQARHRGPGLQPRQPRQQPQLWARWQQVSHHDIWE